MFATMGAERFAGRLDRDRPDDVRGEASCALFGRAWALVSADGIRAVRAVGGWCPGWYRTGQQLSDVDDLERVLGVARALLRGDGVAEHDQAVRAGGGDRVRVQREGFLHPLGVDPLADPVLHAHPGPSRAAGETAVLAPVHLRRLPPADGLLPRAPPGALYS